MTRRRCPHVVGDTVPVFLPDAIEPVDLTVDYDCDGDRCWGEVVLPDGYDPDVWHVDFTALDSGEGVLLAYDQAGVA